MGMNLAGAEVALKLVERIEELELQVQALETKLLRVSQPNTTRRRRRI